MSMTPSGRRSRSVVTIAIERKYASRLISSASSANRYSSPPQLYRVRVGSSIGCGSSSLAQPFLEGGGVEVGGREPRLAQQLGQQPGGRGNAVDAHLAQRP